MIYECIIANQSSTVQLPVLETIENGYRSWHIWLKKHPGESSAPVDLSLVSKALFILRETEYSNVVSLNKEMGILNPPEGLLFLELSPEDVDIPGLWHGTIQLLNPQEQIVDEITCRLLIKKSATGTSRNTPITVEEVRNFLMDRCPEDNRLLFDTQYTDEQIINAMAMPIDDWNDTPPCIQYFSPVTFPWRRPLIIGTAAALLNTHAFNQFRNEAAYQAGNVTVNDSNKGPIYLQLAQQLHQEWKHWMVSKKRELNIQRGWGSSAIKGF